MVLGLLDLFDAEPPSARVPHLGGGKDGAVMRRKKIMRIVHMFMSSCQNQHDVTEYIMGKLIP